MLVSSPRGSDSAAFSRRDGRPAKAASVGANTVNGPGPLSVLTNPAAVTAVTSVENAGLDTATSTMSASTCTMRCERQANVDELVRAGVCADAADTAPNEMRTPAKARTTT